MRGPAEADFNFVDLASRERWTLRLGDGFFPWWIFDDSRRVPNTRMRDYLVLARLMVLPGRKTIGEMIDCSGALYERLVEPFFLATLNNAPPESSARLAATLAARDDRRRRAHLPSADRDGGAVDGLCRSGARVAEGAWRRMCASSMSCIASISREAARRALDFGGDSRRARTRR